MSTFVILAICLTVAYVIYYAIMIGLDLTKQPGQKKSSTEVINVAEEETDEGDEGARKVKMLDDGEIVNIPDNEQSGNSDQDPVTSEEAFNIPAAAAAVAMENEDANDENPDPQSDNEQNAQNQEEEGETTGEPSPENEPAEAGAEDTGSEEIPDDGEALDMGSEEDNAPENADEDIATVSLDEDDNDDGNSDDGSGVSEPGESSEAESETLDEEESVKDILEEFTASLEPVTPRYFKALTAEQLTEEILKEDSYIVKKAERNEL